MTASRLCTTVLFLVGFQMVAFGQWPARMLQPDSDIAEALRESLDDVVQLGQIDTNIGQLGNVLSERLDGIPIFVDARGVKMAELSLSDKVQADIKPLPLRSALRSLLAPLGLRAVIQQEGLDITADFTSLTRRGIATDRWVDVDQDTARKFQQILDAPFSGTFVDLPLSDVVAEIGDATGLPLLIDGRALEEIGLAVDQPVSLSLKDVPLRSLLNLLLREMDLTYIAVDNVLQVTTIEAAEQNLQNRLYWLEGTGVPIGDFQSIIDLIQTSIVPDTWEALGGPSTLAPATLGNGNRPAILVSTTYPIHERIAQLLESLREAHLGPDPVVAPAKDSPKIQISHQ